MKDNEEFESKTMKDVPGWKLHEILYSKRWMKPVDNEGY